MGWWGDVCPPRRLETLLVVRGVLELVLVVRLVNLPKYHW